MRSSAGVLAARVLVSLVSGLVILASFPPYDLWWLAPVGVGGLTVAVCGCRPAVGALCGWVCGLALFLPLLSWTNLHTGWFPWVTLSAVQAAYFVLPGWLVAWCWRSLVVGRLWVLAPLTGVAWAAQEAVRSRVPFGGFPWGRLAFGQVDSPLLPLAALGGAPLVSCAVAMVGGLLAAGCWVGWRVRYQGFSSSRQILRGCVTVGVVLGAGVVGGWLVPVEVGAGERLTVAIVQGNVPRLGLDFNAQRRAVLDNHVTATLELAEAVEAGTADQPDLVVWPENSSDIDPLVNEDAAALIESAAQAIGVPILVGAVLDDGDHALNAGLLWESGLGVTQRYVKRHPVPFAEYVPFRSLVRLITTQVDEVRVDFAAGKGSGVLRVGQTAIGDVICFEVAYDGLVWDVVDDGAELIVVQTNNATFNESEAAQQLAMVRFRAVEHGRPALMASTVGISAFVDATGRVEQETGYFTAETLVQEVSLESATTVATRVGALPEYGMVGVAAGMVVVGWVVRRRQSPLSVLDDDAAEDVQGALTTVGNG